MPEETLKKTELQGIGRCLYFEAKNLFLHEATLVQCIVNKGEWLYNQANIKGANKDAKIYVGRSTTLRNLLFCSHTLCMNYVTNTFLLVTSSVRSKQLLYFAHGQGQKSEQTPTTKNFVGFHNHSPLLTMFSGRTWENYLNMTINF